MVGAVLDEANVICVSVLWAMLLQYCQLSFHLSFEFIDAFSMSFG